MSKKTDTTTKASARPEIRDTTGNVLSPGMYGYETALAKHDCEALAKQRASDKVRKASAPETRTEWADMTKDEQTANVQAHYDKASKASAPETRTQQPRHIYDQRCRSWDIEHGKVRTLPAEKPTAWTAKDIERKMLRLNNQLIEVEAHADALAEALQQIKSTMEHHFAPYDRHWCIDKATQALAAWEGTEVQQ